MKQTMHILFGFEEENSINIIVKLIRSKGYEVKFTSRVTKESISAYLAEHPDCEHAVLRESMGAEKFSIYELTTLTDLRDVNIVAIIDSNHRETDFMHSLYAAGIVNAIYSDGKSGAQPAAIAQLLMEKRTRRKARSYYGIDMAPMQLDILTYEAFTMQYTKLMDETVGLNLVDRYISVVNELSTKQAADFTMRIPAEIRKKLAGYEEFYFVLNAMKRQGIDVQIQKPAHVKRALTDEQFTRALRMEKKSPVKKKSSARKNSSSGKEVNENEESVTFEEVDNVFWKEVQEGQAEVIVSEEESTPKEEVKSGKSDAAPVSENVVVITDDVPKAAFTKKPRTKIKWKYVAYTFVVGILLVLFWYFLMLLMQVY